MAVRLLTGLALIAACPVLRRFRLLLRLAQQRHKSGDFVPEEQNVVCKRHKREEALIKHNFKNRPCHVEPSEILQLNRDNVHQQHAVFGIQRCKRKQQTEVQNRSVKLQAENHAEKVHQNHAGQIKQIEPQRTERLLQNDADAVVEEQHQQQNQRIDKAAADPRNEQERHKPPNLPVQNGQPVKNQERLQINRHAADADAGCKNHGKKINHRIADRNIKHQISNAAVAVFDAEAIEAAPWVVQDKTSYLRTSYPIRRENTIKNL